jgi:hypothetical protein
VSRREALSARDVRLLGVSILDVAAAQEGRVDAAAMAARNALVDLDKDSLVRVAGFLALAALDGRLDRGPWLHGLRHRMGLGS